MYDLIYSLIFVFFYFNLQFIFDWYTKYYQLEFINSLSTNINFSDFYLFNLFSFVTFILQNYEKIINKKYFEIPLKTYISTNIFKKINNISELWIEKNGHSVLPQLIEKTTNITYNKYNTLLELYGSIIRVITNTYILYYIYSPFIYIIIPYFLLYLMFYVKIIKINQKNTQEDNSYINKKNVFKQNSYLTYYNSSIGNYSNYYSNFIINLYNTINIYSLRIIKRDIIYLGTLQLFQKLLLMILVYCYLINNCSIKCSLFFLPLYQTTITLVYQFEYILHNFYGYNNSNNELVDYNEFMKNYEKNKKINYIKNDLNTIFKYNLHINNTINYDNTRSELKYNVYIGLENSHKYLLTGKTGAGKTTFCKILSGHFNNCNIEISKNILYIPQTIYLTLKDRNLVNIITQNDYNICDININLINTIITDIIPFDDIINSFKDKDNWLYITLEDKTFSGGQEKRIYLAMWIYFLIQHLSTYKILILDEPDKGLDYDTFIKLLEQLFKFKLFNNICFIIVSHNKNIIKHLFTKNIELTNKNNIITN